MIRPCLALVMLAFLGTSASAAPMRPNGSPASVPQHSWPVAGPTAPDLQPRSTAIVTPPCYPSACGPTIFYYTYSDTETFNGIEYHCDHMVVVYDCVPTLAYYLTTDLYTCTTEGGGGYGWITGENVYCATYY